MAPEDPVRAFRSADAWRAWLAKNHDRSSGLRVKIAKKDTGIASVRYPEVLDVALCFGWIDGVRHALDDQYFLQRFSPRRPRSKWSQINCAKATELIESGEMEPAGLREVEAAKADGRWDAAYAGYRAATVPDDLRRALGKNKRAKAFFETLDSRNRYAVLYRIQDAKRLETRARRIEKFVAMLANHETLHA